jgi:putative flippase GtrA
MQTISQPSTFVQHSPIQSVSETKLLNKKDLIAYFLVAGTGALVQLICGSIFRDFMNYNAALTWAYVVSFVVGFVLTKMFAFNARNTNQTRREMVKFLVVSAISLGITVGMAHVGLALIRGMYPQDIRLDSPFGKNQFNISELSGQFIGMGCSFVSNYFLHKTFTFKSTGFYNRLKKTLKMKERD